MGRGLLVVALTLCLAACGGGPDSRDVEWSEYATELQIDIEQAIADKDCEALDEHFWEADEGNEAHAAKYGNNNADLMGYIAESAEAVGCGHP